MLCEAVRRDPQWVSPRAIRRRVVGGLADAAFVDKIDVCTYRASEKGENKRLHHRFSI